MRRIHAMFTMLLLISGSAFAVAPQFWRVRTAEDFLAGEVDGFAITSRGRLQPGPAVRKVASFSDPFVLSQAAGPVGVRYFGTGNEGKVYRLAGNELKLIYTAPEPEIYALAFREGALFVGTSPNGKIYRVDPDSGKSSAFYDPKQAYIWAMRFLGNGDLAVATGTDGKLFRVTPSGAGKLWFDSPETHLRSLAARSDGSLLVGGSGRGRIYAVANDGSAHALYDSALNEISSIYVDAAGVGWAAGVSNILPVAAPAKPQAKPAQPQQTGSTTAQSSGEAKKEDSTATATVDVSFSFEDTAGSTAQPGTSELYRINSDDFVELVRKFDREMVYGIAGGSDGSILLSTGPQGRIYQMKDGEAALIANVPEKQIVSIDNDGATTLITTTNAGAVYRLEPSSSAAKPEFRSAAKDVERFSRFGHYSIVGDHVGNGTLSIAFRSGNTRTPDATWSPWSTPSTQSEGTVGAPSGRYIQWKLNMLKPAAGVEVDSVTVAFVNRNIAPTIDGIAVQDPAVVFITSSYPAPPQVVEATNPDEYGIFTSLDNPREKTDQGKKVFRKGYRTITWRAHDDNGDTLHYSLSFRQKGAQQWLRLRDKIDETQINFDTSQLPDGDYELRLVADDGADNADAPLTDTKEGVEFEVDNTAPAITFTTEGSAVVVRITDKLSAVGKVEYSADAQKWVLMTPVDGIADSTDETFRIPRADAAGKFVIVRASDAFYNVATESLSLR